MDINVKFLHPTDGRILHVTLDGTMTAQEAIGELIAANFIAPTVEGYNLAIERGNHFRDNETFLEAGAQNTTIIIVEKNIRVFISYAKEDTDAAVKLYNDLKELGVKPWIDSESLLPGQKWRMAISQAIRSSQYFIVLLSSNSTTKQGFVQKEIREALEMLEECPESEIFILPARLDECFPSHIKLQELHWVDLFPSWKKGLKKIGQALKIQI